MDRRTLLKALAAFPLAGPVLAAPPRTTKEVEALQSSWKSFLPQGAQVPSPAEPVKLSKDEWKKRLAPDAYRVLREEGTERAGTSPLNDEKRAGIYACAGCGLPVFTSDMKFESGTGWPSFYESFDPAHIRNIRDDSYGMVRIEIRCARCDGHLGHVFPDGPPPTGHMAGLLPPPGRSGHDGVGGTGATARTGRHRTRGNPR